MGLKHFVPSYGTSLEQLPSEKEMAASIRKMAEELTTITSAPVLENYIGPVLVTGQAASELFAQVLAPQLSGQRPPLMEQQQMAAMMTESKLAARLNRRVLPSFFTVVDDPTQKTYEKQQLIGAYKVDDQGVPARPVTLIERGVLKTLLLPIKRAWPCHAVRFSQRSDWKPLRAGNWGEKLCRIEAGADRFVPGSRAFPRLVDKEVR